MFDTCLLALAKDKKLLKDQSLLVQFLERWYRIAKYTKEIFICMLKNSFYLKYPGLPLKAKKKAVFKAAQALMTINYTLCVITAVKIYNFRSVCISYFHYAGCISWVWLKAAEVIGKYR